MVLLLVASLLVLAAFGALAPDPQPSALRVMVASVVALLAPLFWPGAAATPLRTLGRTLVWSLAATLLAGLAMALLGQGAPPALLLPVCAMLLPILLLTHALAAGLQAGWQPEATGSPDAQAARWAAGIAAMLLLALAGAAPLWLGPAAELASARHETALDILVATSPLTHLAVAGGLDLLRTAWLYQNANLAALPVNYPQAGHLAAVYAAACAVLTLALVALQRRQGADHAIPLTENPP
ncbi:hypothetical protein BurJ1DRAFT_1477 [Burkholderiales bacterium JOSHI_001]|nr:hypothetical protein BurJ1DRAFT_1477 [Burkholderiales bacterium JOSHI_001]